jgi:hypothetical protein
MKILTTGNHKWLRAKPPKHRDIRKLSTKFWKKSKAEEERVKRIEILAKGSQTDQQLARALEEAQPGNTSGPNS